MFLIGTASLFINDVLADQANVVFSDPVHYICFNQSTGEHYSSFTNSTSPYNQSAPRCSQGYRDVVKFLGFAGGANNVDNIAYCSNMGYNIGSGTYTEDTSWKPLSKEAIIAGAIIEYTSGDNYKNKKIPPNEGQYLSTELALNLYLRKYLNEAGSIAYPNYQWIINEADKFWKNSFNTNPFGLPKIAKYFVKNKQTVEITSDNNPMKKKTVGNKKAYYSDYIIFDNFDYLIYNGKSGKITVTAKLKRNGKEVSGANVQLCDERIEKNGEAIRVNMTAPLNSAKADIDDINLNASCKTSIEHTSKGNGGDGKIPEGNSAMGFYVKVDEANVQPGDEIEISVLEFNQSVYTSTKRYVNNSDKQKLITRIQVPFNRVTEAKVMLDIPEEPKPDLIKRKLTGRKIDENGNPLDGAVLRIGRVAKNTNFETALKEKKVENMADNTVSKDNYVTLNVEFNKNSDGTVDNTYDYWFYEESTPSGYVPASPIKIPLDFSTKTVTKCYSVADNKEVDMSNCISKVTDEEEYYSVTTGAGAVTVKMINAKNIVRVSKKSATGNQEIAGATLKICSADSYSKNNINCEPAKTVEYEDASKTKQVEMKWISTNSPREFRGIPAGDYYIVEETAPKGYIKATTAVKFSIDKNGTVTSGGKQNTFAQYSTDKNLSIAISNDITELSISKQDVATSKELPGATLSICKTYVDDNNEIQLSRSQYTDECIVEVLANGEDATWVSSNEPKVISGLPAGTYALVEKIAPNGYATAESIIFKINENGDLSDKDGNSLAGNKLVMHDTALQEVKTGSLPLYIIVFTLIFVTVLGVGSYCYVNMNNKEVLNLKNENELNEKKVRQRKIHKNK